MKVKVTAVIRTSCSQRHISRAWRKSLPYIPEYCTSEVFVLLENEERITLRYPHTDEELERIALEITGKEIEYTYIGGKKRWIDEPK